ncbi:MAG TPA: CPBP family intramembrane glutamic endopeptidase [Candidatus Binataceae bacterium]|nr:CPBP family intramembrane glutamic endopeptidase [Candidatus Binataceae bacterium]
MHSRVSKIAPAVGATLLGVFIALFPQGLWAALVLINLKTSPAIPWSAIVMGFLLWMMWRYLGGRWWPRSNSDVRRRYLRAKLVSSRALGWALLAGALAIVALDGLWIVISQFIRMPGSVLPDMSKYQPLTAVLMLTMAALVSPVCEQAGLWGYCQVRMEQLFGGPAAIAISALVFSLLPHPPMNAAFLPKLGFFFLTGLMFGGLAYLTNSILPGLVVHIFGILTFFVLVWPYDSARLLAAEGGADAWFWIHAVQTIVLLGLTIVAFVRLARITRRVWSAGPNPALGVDNEVS